MQDRDALEKYTDLRPIASVWMLTERSDVRMRITTNRPINRSMNACCKARSAGK
jgi:hypothetical protein